MGNRPTQWIFRVLGIWGIYGFGFAVGVFGSNIMLGILMEYIGRYGGAIDERVQSINSSTTYNVNVIGSSFRSTPKFLCKLCKQSSDND